MDGTSVLRYPLGSCGQLIEQKWHFNWKESVYIKISPSFSSKAGPIIEVDRYQVECILNQSCLTQEVINLVIPREFTIA